MKQVNKCKTNIMILLIFVSMGCFAIGSLDAVAGEHTIGIVSSHRDSEVLGDYEREAKELTALAVRLGYSLPEKHLLTFVPAGDLGQLSSMGRYALPHWYDGAQIFKSMGNVSGVLEFVTRGEPGAKSFYSDTTDYIEQISVIMHVLGHNDFAMNSGYALSAKSSSMPASLDLSQYISKLYDSHDHEEVSLFVQWLYSLEYLQDFVDGSYDSPNDLSRKGQNTHDLMSASVEKGKGNAVGQFREISTASVLSASVNQLAPNIPEWKQTLIGKFEAMVRHYPGSVQTKIINEGWATFTQYLLAKHSHWKNNEAAYVELAGLMGAVARPSFSNPYWLGLECWRNQYRRFTARHRGEYKSEFDLDRAFVSQAHQTIAWESSYNFIRSSLDEKWVHEHNIVMHRAATQEELEPFGHDPKMKNARIVVTKNHERIIKAIARSEADFSFVFPKIKMTSSNYLGSGAVLLEHQVEHDLPLELHSAVQALFVYSLVLERPVTLKTITVSKKGKGRGAELLSAPLTISVGPSGVVEVATENSGHINRILQEAVNEYREDLEISESELVRQQRSRKFSSESKANYLQSTFLKVRHDCSAHHNDGSFITHAPSSGKALLEYESVLSSRFDKMLELAVKGHLSSNKTSKGVRFRALPLVPNFSLDQRVPELRKRLKDPAPVDMPSSLPNIEYLFGQDDDCDLDSHPKVLPGDFIPVPQDSDEGDEGDEGDESDESGEEESEQEGVPVPKPGGNTPSDIEIPLEDWGKALAGELTLPNQRETEGQSELLKKKRKGTIKRDHGEIVYRRTVPAALNYPIVEKILAGEELSFGDIIEDLQNGISKLTPSDYFVKARKEVLRPRSKAVVAVVMDFSGSMQGRPHAMAANLVYNFKALVSKHYEDIEFRYIVYDTEAHEFDEVDVFGKSPKFLGGGTSNIVGYEKAKEILDEYPYDQWNKYVLGIGDAGAADGPETVAVLEELYRQTQYMAFVLTHNGFWAEPRFIEAIKMYASENQWMGYGEIKDASQGSTVAVLKSLFPSET